MLPTMPQRPDVGWILEQRATIPEDVFHSPVSLKYIQDPTDTLFLSARCKTSSDSLTGSV